MWCLRRIEKIHGTDLMRNSEVLQRFKKERNPKKKKKRRSLFGLVMSCVGTAFEDMLLKER
jgi:hypothetical protein